LAQYKRVDTEAIMPSTESTGALQKDV